MAKYEISHPRLPQLNGYSLEGPDDKQPTEEDLWFVAKQVVRPYGISQLTDEEKVSAWKNGFFEENQNTKERESKTLEGIGELIKDSGVRFLQSVKLATGGNISPLLGFDPLKAFSFGSVSVTGGPVEKLVNLPDEAIDYKKTENSEQFKEAGKLLYGLLDNTEELSDLPDMVAESLKQAGMPFYANNKGARGRVKAAALDYAEKATVSGLAEGAVRGASTSQFLGRGATALANEAEVGLKDMVGMLDDSDILDLVNSEIGYDQSMQQYEDAADMGAMVLENPGIAAKSVTASLGEALTLGQIDDKDIGEAMGLDVNDITQESELLQDLRSGYVEPDQGISFMTEILADPLNAGTGVVAKGLTLPQRVALSGTIKKTIGEVAVLNKKLAPLMKGLEKMPAEALVRNRVAQAAKPLMDELAQKQAIINKFGRNSLTARFAAQASPSELLKQASKIADNTAAGKMTMDMVYSAMKPAGKMSMARKSVMQAMKLNPEIAGATLGFALGGGVPGMVAGAMLPSMLKGARFLSILPQEVALRFIMRSAADAGQEITEAQAMRQWRMTTNAALYGSGILGLGSLTFGDSGNASGFLGGALALKTLPKLAKFADGFVRDARVVGSEMIFAQTTKDAGPFFNKLSMLPGAEEGLIGANKDRLQMLNGPSDNFFTKPIEPFFTGAKTASKRVGKMTSEFRAGGVGKQPVISETTRNLARFLDNKPMLGRSIEAVGRAGENLAVASALPAALGFVGAKGDVEGAVAGAAISLPFTMAGVGVGQYQKFKNKGELFEQAIGDLHYYREHLTKDEQVAFDKIPMGHRMGISKYSISHPDVVIRPGKKGQGNWHFNEATGQSIIEYNPLTGEGLFDGLLAHEVGHHIEIHGLTPMINKIYFGDPVTGEGGVYGKYDADGNIVTNEEFNAIRAYYNRALIGDESISESDRALSQQDLGITTSEIFAEQVKDYLLSGKKEKGRTAVEKIIRSASDAMMGTSFVRDFLMKIGRPLDGNGKFVEEGFFQGMKSIGKGVKIKRIPEITKLIDKYYSDTRGLRKREIQGDQKTAPGEVPIDRSIRKEGKRPIDQDFDTAFTTEDQNNPAIQAVLNTGGLFKWRANENGEAEVQKGPTGAPLRYTAGELKKEQRKQADHAVKVFEDAGIEILYDKKGNPYTNEIGNLSPEAIDKLAQGPWHPRQIQTLREISRSLQEGDGERAGFLIGYFAASMGRKPKPVPFKYRHEMPYAFRMTKDGNLLVMLHDVDQLQKNLQFLKTWKNLPAEYQQLFDSDNEVWQAFNLYRNKTAKGLKGELDLDPNENRAILKKNFLNALHGGITQQQVALNPLLEKIGYKIASRNTRRGFGAATRSFRIDRVFDVKRSGMQSSPASVDRLKSLYMPRQPKGFDKKVLLRTRQETIAKIDELAQLRGLSRNDVLNMILDGKASLETKVPDQNKVPPLTAEEQRLLSLRSVSEQDASAYRKAVQKRQQIAELEIIGDRKFMPQMELNFSAKTEQAQPNFWKLFKIDPQGKNVYRDVADILIDTGDSSNDASTAFYRAPLLGLDPKILRQEMQKAQRRFRARNSGRKYMPRELQKAQKYGFKLQQASKSESEQIKQARKLWKNQNFESPYLQHFMRGEENEAPVFATLKNQNYKPIPLYYFGELGSPVGQYDKVLNASSIINDSVTKKDSHRWSEELPIVVTANRKAANQKQKLTNKDLKPLVLASNAKYIFDSNNPSHTESITLPAGEKLPTDSQSLFAYEQEIRNRGWHGYKSIDDFGNELVTIFDSKRLKLIEDQSAESKFFSKDRPFGKVSGLFGYPTETSKFSSFENKDIRFMPAPTDLQSRKNMQKFLKASGKPFFAEKVEGGYKPQVLFHRGKIGEKITDDDIAYKDSNLEQFKENLGDKPSWEFKRPTEVESKFLKDHFGMESKDAIYTSENLGGRFSNNFKTKKGKTRKFLKDDSNPVNELPNDTIRVITNISKVWDYKNVKDIEKVLDEVAEKFTTTEMFTHGFVNETEYGKPGFSQDSMRIGWLSELPYASQALGIDYNGNYISLAKQREGMVEFLNHFKLFDKYKIDKSKLLSDFQYFSEVQDGIRWVDGMLSVVGNDIAIMRGLADGNDVKYGSGNKYYLQEGYWSNESLIPIIESLGYEGMRNIDSDSGGDVPSKSVLIFDSKNVKLIHGKGLKNYGTFDSNNPDIRYMPSLDQQIDQKAFKLLNFKTPKFQKFITAKGTPALAKKDSEGNYIPVKVYHAGYIGTNHHHIYGYDGARKTEGSWTPKLDNKSYYGSPDAFFVSTDKGFTEMFARNRIGNEGGGFVPAPIELVTNVSKVWDYANQSHRELLNDTSLNNDPYSTNWEAIEGHSKKIKELGFDAFKIKEGQHTNYGIFNFNDIKLVKDVNDVREPSLLPLRSADRKLIYTYRQQAEVAGSFNPSSSDIRYIPAYHGTPHTFAPEPGAPLGKFRTSAIGTGEGAQAYGHGLYFAGKRDVAEYYRKALARIENPNKWREKPNIESFDQEVNFILDDAAIISKNNAEFLKDLEALETQATSGEYEYSPSEVFHIKKAVSLVKSGDVELAKGSVYKVELAPKENEYLLYDKTLGEQPKGVQDKLKKFLREQEGEDTWQYRQEQDYRDITNNVLDNMPEAEISKRLKEAGIPGIKYLDGSSRSKGEGNYNYVIFDEADVTVTDKLFMPASEAGATKGKVPKSGDMLTLDDKSLKLFLPSPSNPNASLSDFKGKNVQVLTADLSVVGDKKADGAMISFTGGPGYLSVNDAWGFTNEAGAKAFKTRWERDGKPLIGITSMKQENHRASTLTREYYVRKFMEAINDGKISENTVNRHIKTALKRAIDGKNGLTNNQKAALKTVKTIEGFLKVFPDKELIPWKATPMIYGKLDAKTLPIKQDRLKKLGLDTDTILRETRQPEYNDIKKGSLLAIAEYDGSGATYRPDLNSAYPWSIPLNEKAFLKDFADIQDLSSRQDLRGSDGEANMAVAMGAGVMLDKLGRGDVNFMPSDPKAPTRQPANRITRQAPAMPGNRFMAPAVSAGAKSAERFR